MPPRIFPDRVFDGLTATLAVPTYGPVDPACAKTVRNAVMHASNRGLLWAGDASPDRQGWSAARNTVAQHVWENQAESDGVMWIDSDIVVPADAITRLLLWAQDGYDFVTGIYHQRMPVHNPILYSYNPALEVYQPAEEYPANTLAPADGCGFGFVWTSTKLIAAVRNAKTFDPHGGWFKDTRDQKGGFGEDMSFCWQAARAGFQLYVDTGVQVGHSGEPTVVTREHYLAARSAVKNEPPKSKTWG